MNMTEGERDKFELDRLDTPKHPLTKENSVPVRAWYWNGATYVPINVLMLKEDVPEV